MKKLMTTLLLFFAAMLCYAQEPYKNEKLDINTRASDLLQRLTPDEKISLLIASSSGIPRLGIPKYYHGNEALHGIVRPGQFTVFPQAIALSATWNPTLIHTVASMISDEARARWNELDRGRKQRYQFSDLLTFWSPTVNMARDPRWGRTPETYGEDPFLTGTIGTAFVQGLQGDDARYLKVVSTPKHFVANNEEHNRFECDAKISEKVLREYYLAAFEQCIRKGKAESIMSAYNAINGVPCTTNKWLLTKVLRGDWGFQGYVVSDCGAPDLLRSAHRYAKDKEQAATLALKAGLDLECGDDVFTEPLQEAYRKGDVTLAEIDSAAFHVLRARMRLGLFDREDENPYNRLSPSLVGCKEHQQEALETARQSIVLLKNAEALLPLDVNRLHSVAVVGLNAAKCEFGDYSGTPVNAPVSILQGIYNKVGDKVKVNAVAWRPLGDNFEIIGEENLPGGLKAEYFDNDSLTGTPKTRTDKTVNYDPANQPPDPFLTMKAPMSIRWTGTLKPSLSGEYTLNFVSDDGVRVYLDGKRVIDHWNVHARAEDKATLQLAAGKTYDLRVEYFDGGGEAIAKLQWYTPAFHTGQRTSKYADALEAARRSDVVVAVMGIDKNYEREGQDRDDINLPAEQTAYLQDLYEANSHVVLVLVAGSSLAINWENDHLPAIVNAWYPGEQGGNAVADVLFGDYNPAGRLPLTYYKSTGDLPPFDDYDVTKGRTYKYFQGSVLYPFGYGLSYTTFKYDALKVKEKGDSIVVSFDLANTGDRDGDEVAQVYVCLPDRSGEVMPLKELKGFARQHLAKGSHARVSIALDRHQLRYWDDAQKCFVYPAGTYTFLVGASSKDIRLKLSKDLHGIQ